MRVAFFAFCLICMAACPRSRGELIAVDFTTRHENRLVNGTLTVFKGVPESMWTVQNMDGSNLRRWSGSSEEVQESWETIANDADLDKYAVRNDTMLSFHHDYIDNRAVAVGQHKNPDLLCSSW
ncbi:MAG: hypothetical protein JWQ98_3409 [Chlorobi bacterium]|nr:hypothetical protein [Chlorobiota bacterium]